MDTAFPFKKKIQIDIVTIQRYIDLIIQTV